MSLDCVQGMENKYMFGLILGQGTPLLLKKIGFSSYFNANINLKVSDILKDGEWFIPPEVQHLISNLILPYVVGSSDDKVIWIGNINGVFSVPAANNNIRIKLPSLH